jgi:hypothetical protein
LRERDPRSFLAILEYKRAPFDVANVTQSSPKRVDADPLTANETQHADADRSAGRLALCDERQSHDNKRERGRTQSPRHAHKPLSLAATWPFTIASFTVNTRLPNL